MEAEKTKIEISTKTILKIIAILLGLWFLFLVRDVILLLFIAVIIAASIDPAVDYLQKRKIPRILGTALIYVGLFSAVTIATSFIIPPIVSQLQDFSKNSSMYFGEIGHPLSLIENNSYFSLQNISDSLSADIANIQKNIFSKTVGVFSGMLSAVLVFSMAFYMVMEENGIKKSIVSIVPEKNKEYASSLIDRIKDKIGKWMIGQLFLMLFIFLLVFVGLSLIGIPYALILAIFAGILEIVPYVGPIVFSIPGIILGFLISPITGLMAILVYIIAQQIESHIIVPLVMKKAVGLNPVVTIVVILIGLKIAGVLGAIVAVPLATAVSLVINDLMGEELDKFFKEWYNFLCNYEISFMKNKKEITIEDLAGMVQKGFLEIKGEFENAGNKFEKIDKRLEKLEKGQKEIIEKLDKKADRFELQEIKHRVETLELKASWGK